MPGPDSHPTDDRSDDLTPGIRALVERRRAIGPVSRGEDEAPLEFVSGEGTRLFDADGGEFLDAHTTAQAVGHCEPRVVQAIAAQAARLATHPGSLDRGVLDYAEDLLGTFPGELSNVLFTGSGSEANDLALRIVRAATNAKGIVVTRNAYHGVTIETAAISPSLGGPTTLPGWVRVVDAPHGDGSEFAGAVASAARELRESEYGFAGFIADSIFASDGVVAGTFLADVADAVREAGGLMIADEVICGFGRLGTGLWGFEAHGFVPDLVTLGGPMGNGLPAAAVVLRPEHAAAFANLGGYSASFAGNPVAIAAAHAVLGIVRADGVIEGARAVGDYLQLGLSLLASASDSLGTVRGSGLFLGIDVTRSDGAPDAQRAAALVAELQRRRVLVRASGLHRNVIAVRPPLVFGIADADHLLEQFYGALLSTEAAASAVDSGPAPPTSSWTPPPIDEPALDEPALDEPALDEQADARSAGDDAPDADEATAGEPDAEDVVASTHDEPAADDEIASGGGADDAASAPDAEHDAGDDDADHGDPDQDDDAEQGDPDRSAEQPDSDGRPER